MGGRGGDIGWEEVVGIRMGKDVYKFQFRCHCVSEVSTVSAFFKSSQSDVIKS